MEDLIEVIFVLIAIGASLLSSAIKARKRSETAKQQFSPAAHQAASTTRADAHPYAPAGMAAPEFPAMSFGDVPGQVITPTVHTHVQPDCTVHDAPGSLGTVSPEGKDPCHEEQLTHRRTVDEPAQPEGGLHLDWSGESLVKTFVMQEVLARPRQRRAQ